MEDRRLSSCCANTADASALHAAAERLEFLSAAAVWIELVRDATPPYLVASFVRGPRAGSRMPFYFDDERSALRILAALKARLVEYAAIA
jgi:hypothetical protein